jgi:hypothetical protein
VVVCNQLSVIIDVGCESSGFSSSLWDGNDDDGGEDGGDATNSSPWIVELKT